MKNQIEESKLKSLALATVLAGTILSPISSKEQQTFLQQKDIKKNILLNVKGPVGVEDISNPDLDMVHGILGSARLSDDFSQRVSDELVRLNKEGYKTDVSNIKIKTYIQGNKIITESSCDIIESTNGVSYDIFTTRGSIGYDFEKRHDKQVDGIIERLKNSYGGEAKKIETFIISFELNNQKIYYKQSFFVASKEKKEEIKKSDDVISKTTKADTYTDLGKKVEQEISNAFKQLNGGKLDSYEFNINNNKEYEIKWKVSKGDFDSFTRRGNKSDTLSYAYKNVKKQVDDAMQRLKNNFESITPLYNIKPSELKQDGKKVFFYEIPIQMKRKNQLNENYIKRMQKLAGIKLNEQFDSGTVNTFGLPKSETKTLAYNFEQYKKIMGSDSIDKIINYLRQQLKKPFTISRETGDTIFFNQPEGYFLQFKGYLVDISSYSFSIGHKDQMGEDIFDYELSVDMHNQGYNLKSLKL